MSEFGIGLREIFGGIWTGILGLLWYDIRCIRKERDTFRGEIKHEYLTKTTHDLLCANVASLLKLDLLSVKEEIIKAIKDNGKCGRRDEGRDLPHSTE